MSDAPEMDGFAVLKAEAKTEPYRVEIPGKGKFEIPHLDTIDIFALNDVVDSAKSELDGIIDVLRLVMPAKDYARLRKAGLNRPTLFALYEAWGKHCGTPAGESSASSD